ncbi:MAG TPA: PHP domain-containing protein [Armatimonadota bacterium]|jgi:hypothetical protein
MKPVDLHAHTTASDGSLSPTELVRHAVGVGLGGLAVTDHDTTDGLAEAAGAAEELGLRFLSGVELSMVYSGHFHLLGYGIQVGRGSLCERLAELRRQRASRNEVMVGKLNDLGVHVTLREVEAEAGGKVVGRPHMALALLRKGYVSSTQDAFNRFLAKGALAYVPKAQLEPEEGFALIRDGGGLPVLAHPMTLKLGEAELEGRLREWKAQGLGGIECYYQRHTEDQTEMYLRLADRLGLVPTGGSDFHGEAKPKVALGDVRGGQALPMEVMDRLVEAIEAIRAASAAA